MNESQENKTEKKQKRKISPRLRWFLRVGGALLLFAMIVQTLFFFFATPILRTTIKRFVENDSEGLYSVEFKKIRVNIQYRRFLFTDFHLQPDTAVYHNLYQSKQIDKALYEIKLDTFQVKGLSIWDYIVDKKLTAEKIMLAKPFVSIRGIPKKTKTTKTSEKSDYDPVHRDLYPVLSKYAKCIEIDEVRLKNGYFDFSLEKIHNRETSRANNISVLLKGFYLDKKAFKTRKRLFYSDNIEISIKDYHLALKDSIHKVNAEFVKASTFTNSIQAKKVHLQPWADSLAFTSYEDKELYYLTVPNIRIKNINLTKIYFDKHAQIEKVFLEKPTIDLIRPKKKSKLIKPAKVENVNPFQLIKGHLLSVEVDTFSLQGGDFSFKNSLQEEIADYKVDSFSVELSNFYLDSLAHENKSKILFSDDIDLHMRRYQMKLKDKIHVIKAGEILVSTSQASIFGTDIELIPALLSHQEAAAQQITLYQINVPFLNINEIDLKRAFNFKEMPVKDFELHNPTVNIDTYKASLQNPGRSKKRDSQNNFKKLLHQYLDIVTIENIKINNGNFNATQHVTGSQKGYTSGVLDFHLTDFSFQPELMREPSKMFYASDVKINFSNYQMKPPNDLHILHIADFHFSSFDSLIALKKLKLSPDTGQNAIQTLKKYNKSLLVDFSLPGLQLRDADIRKAYFDNELFIDSIRLNRPGIEIIQFSGLNAMDTTQIKTDTLSREKQKMQIHDIKDSLLFFAPDTLEIFTRDSLYVQFTDTANNCKNDTVYIAFSDSTLHFSNDSINLYNDSLWMKSIDSLAIYQGDSVYWLANNKLSFFSADSGIMVYQSYKDTLSINQLLTRQMESNQILNFVGNYLNSIGVNSFEIRNGDVKFVKQDSLRQKILSFENQVSVKLRNFYLEPDSARKNSDLFFSKDIEFVIRNYEFDMPGQLYTAKVRRLGLSTLRKEIFARTILLKPKVKLADSLKIPDFLNVYLPKIHITGIDIEKAYRQHQFDIETLLISQPRIVVIHQPEYAAKKTTKIPAKQEFSFKFPENINGISADNIVVEQGITGFVSEQDSLENYFLTTNLALNINDFKLDSSMITPQGISVNAIGDVNLLLQNYTHKLPDSIHTLKAGRVEFSTGEQKIFMKDISLKHDSAYQKQFLLTDNGKLALYDFNLPFIEVDSFDVEKIISTRNVDIGSLYFRDPLIDVMYFREKEQQQETFDINNLNLENNLPIGIKRVKISDFSFDNAGLNLLQNFGDSTNELNISKISGDFTKISIDSTKEKPNRFYIADDFKLRLKDFKYQTPDSFYVIETGEVGIEAKNRKLYLDSFTITPRYPNQTIANKYGLQKGIYTVTASHFDLENLDVKSLIEKQHLLAEKLTLDNLDLYVFKDRRLPLDTTRALPSFHEMIKMPPFYYHLNRVELKDWVVVYEEYAPESRRPGLVIVEDLNADISLLTNDSSLSKRNVHTYAAVSGYLMGEGLFMVNFDFPLNSDIQHHRFEGELKEYDLSTLNSYLENTQFMSIESGVVDNATFEVEANEIFSQGKVKIRYHDAKIKVLDKSSEVPGLEEKGFYSFIANSIIRSNNPRRKALPPRRGDIYFERNMHKPIFHFWVSSLITGLKSTLGFNSKEIKQMRRKERRMEKKLRREERKARQKARQNKRARRKNRNWDKPKW